jgi:hypothetical protein
MKKAELQRALTVSGLYTAFYQLNSLLDELDISDFPEEMRGDIKNFEELELKAEE